MRNFPLKRVAAWSLFFFNIALAISAIILIVLNLNTAGVDVWGFRGFQTYWGTIAAIIGLIISLKQGENPVGWLLLLCGLAANIQAVTEEYAIYTFVTNVGALPFPLFVAGLTNIFWVPGFLIFIHIVFLFFPNGRLPSPRWRPLLIFAIAWMLLLMFTNGFLLDGVNVSLNQPVNNIFRISGIAFIEPDRWLLISLSIVMIIALVVVASLFFRYWDADGKTRHQIKWLFLTSFVSPFASVVGTAEHWGIFGDILLALMVATLPISIGISIVRHQLFDIDVIIRRTLIYSILTGCLAAVYFVTIALIQSTITAVGGQPSAIVIVISTLLIAALFTPLRQRIQAFIDRRFYRSSYDAQAMLAQFAENARDEVEMEKLTAVLLNVVQETMQPETASIWLKKTEK